MKTAENSVATRRNSTLTAQEDVPLENYYALCAAIITQAMTDYKSALRKGNERKARKLERFFRSGWGQMLSLDNGEYIIEKCRREVQEKNPKREVLKWLK